MMPSSFQMALDILNYLIAGVFNCEMIFKIAGFGCYYFRQWWNIFDMSIVIITDLGILVNMVQTGVDFATLATVVRAFRIIRIIRLVKSSTNIKVLLNTLAFIFPTLINMGSLIILV